MRPSANHLILSITGLVVIVTAVFGNRILRDRTERARAISTAYQLNEAVRHQEGDGGNELLIAPPVFAERSHPEMILLMRDLLNSEISAEGLDILAEEGEFGPLKDLFPDQASAWLLPYGLSPDDCVAFKIQRGPLTAELVLHRQPDGGFKVLRANDIRQLAEPAPTP